MDKKINIAIDGYSSCGKGTLAKNLARRLNYIFIDTGAMYRVITFAIIDKRVDADDTEKVLSLLPDLKISFRHNPDKDFYHTLLNGADVEDQIRSMEVNELVSRVSKIAEVRTYLVEQQRLIGKEKGVVMDGRDIGTVVFPDAELKIFMTARPEVRAMRRYKELSAKGVSITFEDVLNNLNSRDREDSARANSPLKMADDAVLLDNSELSKEDQAEFAYKLAIQRIQDKR